MAVWYVFPSKADPSNSDESGEYVENVYFSQGMNFEVTDSWTDPHVTYRYNAKGRFNWKPSADEAIWRNLTDLIDTKGKRAPQIIAQYEKLDTSDRPMSLVIYGVPDQSGKLYEGTEARPSNSQKVTGE